MAAAEPRSTGSPETVTCDRSEHCRRAQSDLTNGLYPTALEHLPLLEALEQLAALFGRRVRMRVAVRQMPEFPQLDPETCGLFFRTARETLTNVARHAAAAPVSISLEADSERIAMRIRDAGRGITPPIFTSRARWGRSVSASASLRPAAA